MTHLLLVLVHVCIKVLRRDIFATATASVSGRRSSPTPPLIPVVRPVTVPVIPARQQHVQATTIPAVRDRAFLEPNLGRSEQVSWHRPHVTMRFWGGPLVILKSSDRSPCTFKVVEVKATDAFFCQCRDLQCCKYKLFSWQRSLLARDSMKACQRDNLLQL